MTLATEHAPAARTARHATLADIPRLLELADILVAHDRQFDPSLSPLYNRSPEGVAWVTAALSDADACVLVADGADGCAAGMLFGRIEEAEPWRDTGGVLAELEMLCVAPESRSGGTGKALVDAFAAWARQRGAVQLWTRVSAKNARAIDFYRREAFSDYDVILERAL